MSQAISNPPDQQVGGNHYADKCGIHPDTFAEANRLTATQFSIVKYLTRQKNPRQDLQKALDFIRRLRFFVYHENNQPATHGECYTWNISPEEYCVKNNLTGATRTAIILVCRFKIERQLVEAKEVVESILENTPVEADPVRTLVNNLAITAYVARNRLEAWLVGKGGDDNHATKTRSSIKRIDELLEEKRRLFP